MSIASRAATTARASRSASSCCGDARRLHALHLDLLLLRQAALDELLELLEHRSASQLRTRTPSRFSIAFWSCTSRVVQARLGDRERGVRLVEAALLEHDRLARDLGLLVELLAPQLLALGGALEQDVALLDPRRALREVARCRLQVLAAERRQVVAARSPKKFRPAAIWSSFASHRARGRRSPGSRRCVAGSAAASSCLHAAADVEQACVGVQPRGRGRACRRCGRSARSPRGRRRTPTRRRAPRGRRASPIARYRPASRVHSSTAS